MSEKLENKNKKKEGLTWGSPLCSPAAAGRPASRRPSPPLQPSVVFLPSPRSCCVLARAWPRGHLLLADELLAAWTTPAGHPDPPCSLSLSPGSSLLFLALSLTRPNTTVAAVHHSSRHRPPLAPPTSLEAPPRPPLPPHRSTGLRKPCIAATSPFPSSGSDHHRRRIHRLQRIPEPASTPTATAVSYATVSPSSPPRSLTVGPSPTSAETSTPPAMSPSWPRSP